METAALRNARYSLFEVKGPLPLPMAHVFSSFFVVPGTSLLSLFSRPSQEALVPEWVDTECCFVVEYIKRQHTPRGADNRQSPEQGQNRTEQSTGALSRRGWLAATAAWAAGAAHMYGGSKIQMLACLV